MKKFIVIFFLFIQFLYSGVINLTYPELESFSISYLEDKSKKLEYKDIKLEKFDTSIKNNFNLGYRKGNIWLKFSIKNKTEFEEFVLTLNEVFYEKAHLFYYDNNEKQIKNGVFIPIEERDIKKSHLSYDIKLKKNEERTYYLLLKGKYAYFGSLKLYEKSFFYYNLSNIDYLYIFLFGVLLLSFIFSAFLFFKIREKIYLYYALFVFFNLVYMVNISGLLIYFNLQEFMYKLHFSASLMLSSLILFSIEYFNMKKVYKYWYKAFFSIALIFILLGILILYSYEPWNKVINNLAGITCLLLIAFSLIMYLKGQIKTKYYILALAIYFSSILCFTFMVNGVFEYNNLTRYSFIVGVLIEVIIFSLLLANRYDEMNKDIQLYLSEQVNEQTKELKHLVTERELLLKEIHHRVKNNFHTINGILWIESMKDNANSQTFKDIANRIKSMSMIHEYLYKSKDLTNINIKEYLVEIIESIKRANTNKNFIISENIQELIINFDDALSLGIILNELLNNSLKHNPKVKNLECHVEVKEINGKIVFKTEDNGKGFDLDNTEKGLGLKLIEEFSNKINESIYKLEKKEGMSYSLRFKNS